MRSPASSGRRFRGSSGEAIVDLPRFLRDHDDIITRFDDARWQDVGQTIVDVIVVGHGAEEAFLIISFSSLISHIINTPW
jgi:hypothetical protein